MSALVVNSLKVQWQEGMLNLFDYLQLLLQNGEGILFLYFAYLKQLTDELFVATRNVMIRAHCRIGYFAQICETFERHLLHCPLLGFLLHMIGSVRARITNAIQA